MPWANPCLSPRRDLTHSLIQSFTGLTLGHTLSQTPQTRELFFFSFLGVFDRRYDGRGPLLPDEPEEAWPRGDHQQSR